MLYSMPNLLQRTSHTADMNWTPLSLVMAAGTPNLDFQPATRASAQAVAVIEDMGTTSSHLVVLSVIFFLLETSLPPVSSTCSFEQAVRGRL